MTARHPAEQSLRIAAPPNRRWRHRDGCDDLSGVPHWIFIRSRSWGRFGCPMRLAGGERHAHVRDVTVELLARRQWLQAVGLTHVAMESTGVHGKPIYYLLED